MGMSAVPSIFSLFFNYPPITRSFLVLIAAFTLSCYIELLIPEQLSFSLSNVVEKKQGWRIVTAFLYFGEFNLEFLLSVSSFLRYLDALERGFYKNKKAEMCFMLLFNASCLLLSATFLEAAFLGDSLAIALLYLWARRNRNTRMSLLGVLEFPAPYFPYLLILLLFLTGKEFPLQLLVGLLVGHLYYFLKDVCERKYSKRILKTPNILLWLFNEQERPLRLGTEEITLPEAIQETEDNEQTEEDGWMLQE